mgnify:CR=1 FL=1
MDISALQTLRNQRQVDVPQQATEAEENHTSLDRAVCGAEKVGNGPDLVRVPNELKELLAEL